MMEEHERLLEERRYNDHRARGAGLLAASAITSVAGVLTGGIVGEHHGWWFLAVTPPIFVIVVVMLVLSSRAYKKARDIEDLFVYTHNLKPPERRG